MDNNLTRWANDYSDYDNADMRTAWIILKQYGDELYKKSLWADSMSVVLRFFVVNLSLSLLLLVMYIVFVFIQLVLEVVVGIRLSGGWFFALFFILSPIIVSAQALYYYPISQSKKAKAGKLSGYQLTKFVLGARDMSTREEEAILKVYNEILEKIEGEKENEPQEPAQEERTTGTLLRRSSDSQIVEVHNQDGMFIYTEREDKDIKSFSDIFVIDSPLPQSYSIGTTLYLTSGAIDNDFLPVMIAHELGHLYYKHSGMVEALRLLTFPLFQLFTPTVRQFSTKRPASSQVVVPSSDKSTEESIFYAIRNNITKFAISLVGGGLGVMVYSISWAKYFRYCDHLADWFAVSIGYRQQLIEYLEENKFYDSAIPYMLGWQPVNELRIDALYHPSRYTEKIMADCKDVKILGQFTD